jgi:hypothetical protein
MLLLHPWMLLALPLAAVPLILHLVQRREPPTVEFPAVRYLVQVSHEHQRRLKLRHWLLLLVRTLLILALVLAAAGPVAPLASGSGHLPSSLVLIVDDSPSSGSIVSGAPRLLALRRAAARIASQATAQDRLWLLTSDGFPRRETPAELGRQLDSLEPSSRRMDLGQAIASADALLRGQPGPATIVVLSDLQWTALSPATLRAKVLVAEPTDSPPHNVGVARLAVGAVPWTGEGGRVTVTLDGDSGDMVPVAVRLGDRPPRQALVPGGGAASFTLGPVPTGWWPIRVSLPPDEFRGDDEREALIRVAPPAAVTWSGLDRYLAAACEVLVASGRLARGSEVTVGSLGSRLSVVLPPADAAEVGALNRALQRRGVPWRLGQLLVQAAETDSGSLAGRISLTRRYQLTPTGAVAGGAVITTAGGAPWIVRGAGVVLVGSRFEPTWTGLPTSAGFLPFLDALLNQVARGQLALLESAPGDPVRLPDQVTEVVGGDARWRVEGGASFRPRRRGGLVLLSGSDTVGTLNVNLDARESELHPATTTQVRALWPGARVVDLSAVAGAAFGGGGASMQGPLLWLALGLALLEVALASGIRRGA